MKKIFYLLFSISFFYVIPDLNAEPLKIDEESEAPPVYTSSSDHTMHGMYGPYSMTREASGTSWQPDSSPMEGMMWMPGGWMLMLHGFADLVFDHQGGPRGGNKIFSPNMLMFMAQKDLPLGTFGFRSMLSIEPTMGKRGYPLLFQTGETADGINHLIDRQHPHDAFMELAVSYSVLLPDEGALFAYLGLPGEPALGPPTFMHRFSGEDIPEAPIAHHWLDSTHVAFGVATVGYIWNFLKLEASSFKGREPDQFRWNIESPRFDSYAVRLSLNPWANWAFQMSYGHIVSPEQLDPDVNTNRTTISVMYNLPLSFGNWQTTLAWGQNANQPGHTLHAYLLESGLQFLENHTVFARFEKAQKDELITSPSPLADNIFTINKFTLGFIYDFYKYGHIKVGVGGLGSGYAIPHQLDSIYHAHPFSCMIFGRVKIG